MIMDRIDLEKHLQRAYKKLKSSVFFDKTQLILRDKIVTYEMQSDFDPTFSNLAEKLVSNDRFKDFCIEQFGLIKHATFPKKIKRNEEGKLISNWISEKVQVEESQYFIDMDVEGQIVGVLWLIFIGKDIDKDVYEHSYGNRLSVNLINEETKGSTFSPHLFEPYFQQYESWRDTALSYAQKSLEKHQDVIVFTLDFKRFYYQVNIEEDAFYELVNNVKVSHTIVFDHINEFVLEVIKTYSRLLAQLGLHDINIGDRNILPIGFFPSNVLANWCLKGFDDSIINGWNPIYYGRYVDDVIIVEKIEKNSRIYKDAKEGKLKSESVIDYYLLNCSAWKRGFHKCDSNHKKGLLFKKDNEEGINNKNASEYGINDEFNTAKGSDIIVQNEKVKVFYFNSGHTDALLACFKDNISKNKSEFRYMPEDEAVFQNDNYSDIYNLHESDSVNKLRGVDGISVDKFQLSKFLGKYMRISGLVNDAIESKFEIDIVKIFDHSTIIENFTTWEKIIQVFVINNRFEALIKFTEEVSNSVRDLELEKENNNIANLKQSLLKVLVSSLCKSFALNWGKVVHSYCKSIVKILQDNFQDLSLPSLSVEQLLEHRRNYCFTRMFDKYAVPILIENFVNDKGELLLTDDIEFNLTDLNSVLSNIDFIDLLDSNYIYFPYLVNLYDITIYLTLSMLKETPGDEVDIDSVKMINNEKEIFVHLNYPYSKRNENTIDELVSSRKFRNIDNAYGIKIGKSHKKELSIAIANARLYDDDFYAVIKDTPNRTYVRYEQISSLVNQSIKEKADLLVMPEAFVPFEWLPIIARTSAKNQLAIVCGVEHFKIDKCVYDITAVILPYEDELFRCAQISFHLKKHYAPHERQILEGYRLKPVSGRCYELYCWNDCWFSVYCCYELTSIIDRSIFQSLADALIAVEWNSDVNYYSNIVDSLSRDLHCYCIQVNSSHYGDSRITKPSKTEEKDVIRMRGGSNPTVLIEKINIESLREFQLEEFELQKLTTRFKPTPPDFKKEVVEAKIKGTLWKDESFWD